MFCLISQCRSCDNTQKSCSIQISSYSHANVRIIYEKTKGQIEAPLRVFGIRDIRGKNYRDTGYLRKTFLGYRILRSSFRDTGYSPKIVTYQMFDEKRSWITK